MMGKVFTFFINCWGFVRSLYVITKHPNKTQYYYGYMRKAFAIKYANKRYKWWPKEYDQKGKDQGVFEIENDGSTLIVLSPLELKLFKKRKVVRNPQSYMKVFKRESIYNTLNK